ncbi:MAG: nickel-dependent lactate racemase [Firmicutes bacterium]|nr:nickel-dependent lactate racemase [Bacillota bacterium]
MWYNRTIDLQKGCGHVTDTLHFDIPYGRGTLPLEIPAGQVEGVLTSRVDEIRSDRGEAEIVRDAMAHPYGGTALKELAAAASTCTVIISDHTRPVPSRVILPPMLTELREGNPDIDITLLVATGCHRGTTAAELEAKLGTEIYQNEKIVVHDATDPDRNEKIGVLPSGADLIIDKTAVHTDLLIAEGFIEPHFFAGFSGGRKSVLPGICDKVTVFGNHCAKFINDPAARTGILADNPIHTDMVSAARQAHLAYIVNVVLDEGQRVAAAYAGDPFAAHEAGCGMVLQYFRTRAIPADIGITSNGGAPLDQNVYQCVKSMTAAEATVRDGGPIIICAECADGIGGDSFYRALRDCRDAQSLLAQISQVPQAETIQDQWQVQILARILIHHPVIMVTRPELAEAIHEMKMHYAANLQEALQMARRMAADSGCRDTQEQKITVIPNGISVIVTD